MYQVTFNGKESTAIGITHKISTVIECKPNAIEDQIKRVLYEKYDSITELKYKPFIDDMVKGYLVSALWSSTDMNGDPLDDKYSYHDFKEKSIELAQKDCASFEELAGELLNGHDDSDIGHNFWLTRNGHGAGFWDGGYEHGDELTKISDKFGELHIENMGDFVWFYGYEE